MIELKLVTVYYISINYHTAALENDERHRRVRSSAEAAHEPGN